MSANSSNNITGRCVRGAFLALLPWLLLISIALNIGLLPVLLLNDPQQQLDAQTTQFASELPVRMATPLAKSQSKAVTDTPTHHIIYNTETAHPALYPIATPPTAETMLQVAARLREQQPNTELPDALASNILEALPSLNTEQQLIGLDLLRRQLPLEALDQVGALLHSPYQDVREEAFILLADYGVTPQTQAWLKYASHSGDSWIEEQAKRLLALPHPLLMQQ